MENLPSQHKKITKFFDIKKIWLDLNPISISLIPISLFFFFIIFVRKKLYKFILRYLDKPKVPVLIVGNITVGGTGKTPFIIWLINKLNEKGVSVAVISKGYKRKSKKTYIVDSGKSAEQVGDEPLLIHKKTSSIVIVSTKRRYALKCIQNLKNKIDLIVCDDGLQDYIFHRDFEIIIVESKFFFGNKLLLPAGPLREKPSRINEANILIFNGGGKCAIKKASFNMNYDLKEIYNLIKPKVKLNTSSLKNKTFHAVCGIAHPEKFYESLENLGLRLIRHSFPDHFFYKEKDLTFELKVPIIMTEKDAMKCLNFKLKNIWVLKIDLIISDEKKIIDKIIQGTQ